MPALGSPALSSKHGEVPLLDLPRVHQQVSSERGTWQAHQPLGSVSLVDSLPRSTYLPEQKHAASWPCLAVAGQAVILGDASQGWAMAADSSVRHEKPVRPVGTRHRSGEGAIEPEPKGSSPECKNATSHHFWAAPSSPAPSVDVAVKTVRTCCKSQLSYGVKPPLWTQLLLRAELPSPEDTQSQQRGSGPLGHPLQGPPGGSRRAAKRSKSSSLLS
mmetsp:Transcript_13512/g.24850  ORF Transcript_13512/g.24850 Transcript_13512/m.24850 type:complete len:217 (+) Transcript_13512:43-693(+)